MAKQRADTARQVSGIFGNSWTQKRAREVLPVLVAMVESGIEHPPTYKQLAKQVGIPFPLNLNRVLGAIGRTLEDTFDNVPPIQCLVVNQGSGICSAGVGWFLGRMTKAEFDALPDATKQAKFDECRRKIFAYRKWNQVLKKLGLSPVKSEFAELISDASGPIRSKGESEQHKALKKHVADNPAIIELPDTLTGKQEERLPSGDSLDVSFVSEGIWVAVEVKAANAPEKDVTRGIFQCVKYAAVMKAIESVGKGKSVRAVLVLESRLKADQRKLAKRLGVKVIEGVKPV